MKHITLSICLVALALAWACSSTVSGGNDVGKDVSFQFQDTGGEMPCTPLCGDKECGSNGCGGTCGTCADGAACKEGVCKECTPDCEGKDCGSDGCGGKCGDCGPNTPCEEGVCGACLPDCKDKECGTDGCDATCGECGPDQECSFKGKCATVCPALANCTGLQCGTDGCGGVCGECPCAGCSQEQMYCGLDGMCADVEADMNCAQLLDCLDLCGKDGPCQDGCLAMLAHTEEKKWEDLDGCLESKGYYACWDGCPEDAETVDDCPADAQKCFDDKAESCMPFLQACLPSGDLGCKAMWLCIMGCQGEQSCVDNCRGAGTLVAQKKWAAFSDCLDTTGYFACDSIDDAQDKKACQAEAWDGCIEFLEECAQGTGSCADIWLCTDTCDADNELCYYKCLYYGAVDAQHEYTGVIDCVTDECGAQPEQECYNTALAGTCNKKYTDCVEE